MTDHPHRIALIGAGPRGTSVLERLISHHRAHPEPPPLAVEVIDPFEPGSGHVWRRNQSRRFLMNTPALYPTVMPGDDWPVPSVLAVGFDDWRRLVRRGGGRATPGPGVGPDADDVAEAMSLGRADFPSRALYGAYLRWTFARLLEEAGDSIDITVHRAEAVRLTPAHGRDDRRTPAADGGAGRWTVHLSTGVELAVESAVLALGHLPAELREDQQDFVLAAESYGVRYWPPNIPADVEWDEVPEGEPILVRGLGLNFFDTMIALTEGRGGRFVETGAGAGAALRYERSGREPLLYAASRRGTPYRAKAALNSYIPAGVRLRFCTDEKIHARTTPEFRLGFNHDIWPLLRRDVLWTYYRTLARTSEESFRGHWASGSGRTAVDDFLVELDAVLRIDTDDLAEPWEQRAERLVSAVVVPQARLRLDRLAKPFEGRRFDSQAEFDAAVIDYLRDDAAGRAARDAAVLINTLPSCRQPRPGSSTR